VLTVASNFPASQSYY